MTKTDVQANWLLYLIVASLPFGPSVANIVSVLSVLYIFVKIYRHKLPFPTLSRSFWVASTAALAYVLWMGLVTVLNAKPIFTAVSSVIGYLPWAIFPWLFKWAFPNPSALPWNSLKYCLLTVTGLWALLLLSQYFFEWRFDGLAIVPNEARPRGFYSHPLSLAYGLLLFWPLALEWLQHERRKPGASLFVVSIAIGLVLTQSRTVQAVAALVLMVNLLRIPGGRKRWLSLGCLLLAGTLVFSTQNIVRDKFVGTFSAKGMDRFSTYPDDRLAFWHVHALMVWERPMLGHGWGMDDAYRLPYYAQIGLPNFKKPYGAHNVFLQILAEGGIIGLSFFLIWLAAFLAFSARGLNPFARSLAGQSLMAFFLASLTQNTMQDFSVRLLLTWLCTALVLSAKL